MHDASEQKTLTALSPNFVPQLGGRPPEQNKVHEHGARAMEHGRFTSQSYGGF